MHDGMSGQASRIRNIIGGSAGNMVEWYDWYIYAAFALYFAPAFFPAGDTVAQQTGAALIFWAGFLMRPVGAWIMGVYADHKGRKAGLSLIGQPDVLRLAADRARADLCAGGLARPGDADRRAADPGAQPRRRIWLFRDLFERGGGARAARLLLELPICDPDLRPADRLGGAA